MVSQHFVLRHYAEKDNAEGLNTMFSTAILRAFRTFIYAKIAYHTHYLSSYNLWMLCLYARPTLEKMQYLFEKLKGDSFFKEVDYNTKLHHSICRIPEENELVMDEILDVLAKDLKIAYEKTKIPAV